MKENPFAAHNAELIEKVRIFTKALQKIAKYSNVMIGYGFEDINNWATEALNTNH